MEGLTEWLGLSSTTHTKLILTGVVILVLILGRTIVARALIRRSPDDIEILYRTRKGTTYVAVLVGVIAVVAIWFEALGGLGTFLGLTAAGIAIALSDVLKNFAGWVYIVLRRPLRVDDRIEIAGHKGDVVDVRMFRFSLLEIGNWVDADQSTGRIVHVPNGKVFTEPIGSYTEGFSYVWHELPVLVTFESDWHRAEELILEAMNAHSPDVSEAAGRQIREAASAYKIRYRHLEPTVYVRVETSGVLLTGRVLVEVRTRRGVEQQIWRAILDAFHLEPRVQFAYPTIRTYSPPPPER
ncbi:MAG: mechanosensitive ion channel family protein [Actinobacteria bacterium]|nr:mechanosensitive ion channel family protein [Actinomycetota bacterium]